MLVEGWVRCPEYFPFTFVFVFVLTVFPVVLVFVLIDLGESVKE